MFEEVNQNINFEKKEYKKESYMNNQDMAYVSNGNNNNMNRPDIAYIYEGNNISHRTSKL